MKQIIGFSEEQIQTEPDSATESKAFGSTPPKRSVVQVYFPQRNMELAYYNDAFDLKPGDMVYVDGKLEGKLGRVTEVNYNFKINLSYYKRVISVVDTDVKGRFCFAGSHFVTFDRNALPAGKVLSWFKAPRNVDDEVVCGSDDTRFSLNELEELYLRSGVSSQGYEYYNEGKIIYLSVDSTKGYAIIEGREAYEVEFDYEDGRIGNIVCSCFCSYFCKHEFAALLQLKEILQHIERHYKDEYIRSGYFAAVNRRTLYTFAFGGKQSGSFTL